MVQTFMLGNDYILRWASINGHLDIVKYLEEN